MSDDDELVDEDLDDEELDVEGLDEDALEPDDELAELPIEDADAVVSDDEVEEDDDVVPSARKKRVAGDDEDEDEEELDPDDVEADLDTILKDRIAAGDDEEEDEEELEEGGPEAGERVAAKAADEFTCPTCFLIVHPRQFGRPGALTCPEGYDPCGAIPLVEEQQRRATKR